MYVVSGWNVFDDEKSTEYDIFYTVYDIKPTVHDKMITILYILLTNTYTKYNILLVQNIY